MTFVKPLYANDLKDISDIIQQTLSRAINGMENFHDLWHRYHVLRELLQVKNLLHIFLKLNCYTSLVIHEINM